MPFGVSVSFKLQLHDYNKHILKANLLEIKKIIVAAAGPLTNVFLIIYYLISDIHLIDSKIAIYSNLVILLFNLLPIYPLDGGRILKGIIHIFYGGKISKIIINKISNFIIVILTIIGSFSIFYLKNISIFLIIIF